MSTASNIIRAQFGAGDKQRDAGLEIPPEVEVVRDLYYGDDHDWQVLDLNLPKERDESPLPVVVSFHGGAWVYGDKEVYKFYCASLAKRGFAVVNFTYRLAPEFKFPASLVDMNLVMKWIHENATIYNLDVKNIYAVGDSAGAHMLSLHCAVCTNREYADKIGVPYEHKYLPKAVALNCGKYDMSKLDSENLNEKIMKDFLGEEGIEKRTELVNVLSWITKDFPPAYIMTCNEDFLRDQAPLMAARLIELKVPFEFKFYGDKNTTLYHVFHCDMRNEQGSKCNDDEIGFFRKFLIN